MKKKTFLITAAAMFALLFAMTSYARPQKMNDGSSVDLSTFPEEFRWYFSDEETFLGENKRLGYRLCEHNVIGAIDLCAECIEWMRLHPITIY